jgi:hypothetical protein
MVGSNNLGCTPGHTAAMVHSHLNMRHADQESGLVNIYSVPCSRLSYLPLRMNAVKSCPLATLLSYVQAGRHEGGGIFIICNDYFFNTVHNFVL